MIPKSYSDFSCILKHLTTETFVHLLRRFQKLNVCLGNNNTCYVSCCEEMTGKFCWYEKVLLPFLMKKTYKTEQFITLQKLTLDFLILHSESLERWQEERRSELMLKNTASEVLIKYTHHEVWNCFWFMFTFSFFLIEWYCGPVRYTNLTMIVVMKLKVTIMIWNVKITWMIWRIQRVWYGVLTILNIIDFDTDLCQENEDDQEDCTPGNIESDKDL